jgi:CRISPR/Cas system CSM-associated protein Csm5 (group 7 of RAMP superfamily)
LEFTVEIIFTLAFLPKSIRESEASFAVYMPGSLIPGVFRISARCEYLNDRTLKRPFSQNQVD